MGQQINQYSIDRTTFGDDDYYDIDYWDGSAYQTAKIKGSVIKAGIIAGIPSGGLVGLYSQISDSSDIRNTTTETSLFNGSTSVGSLMIPADGFAVGDSFHAKLGGGISSQNGENITLRVKSGSVELANTGLLSLPALTNRIFEIELDFTIRAIGGVGVAEIITHGEINFVANSGGGSWEGLNFISVNNTTFDTTIGNMLDITWEWSTASVQNTITNRITNLRKTY